MSDDIKKYEKPLEKKYLNAEKDYSYKIYEKYFQQNEQKLIDEILDERKTKIKSVTAEDLKEFKTKVEEKKKK